MPLGEGDFEYLNVPDNKSLNEFNLLRIELYPDRVDWFINGEKIRTETQTVPNEAMDIRLNFWAPGEEWNDAYDASTVPVNSQEQNQTYIYEIDFVNVERIGGDDYIASYGDLISAFGYNLDAATRHYIEYGYAEKRAINFDASSYLSLYQDLQMAFGNNLELATRHYIEYGYTEGRIW